MIMKIIKWITIPLLLIGSMFTRYATSYEILLNVTICIGALVVVQQAFRARSYLWAAGFVAIAIVFSPLILVAKIFLLMSFTCVASFVTLLDTWKTRPSPAG